MKEKNKINEKKIKLHFFPYDYSTLEKYLEAMAMEGWILRRKENLNWYFQRSEPKALKFRIIPFKKIKNKNQEVTLNRSDLSLKEITEAGWKLISSSEGIHVFYSDTDTDLPGDDKNLTFKLINKFTLNSMIPIIIVCTFLFLYLFLRLLDSSLMDVLMNRPYAPFYLISLLIIIIIYMVELIKYIIWRRKYNHSQTEIKVSKNNILRIFKYRRFVRAILPWIIPATAFIFLITDAFYNETQYPDKLPLTLEDMNVPVTADHKKDYYKDGSFLLNYSVYFHKNINLLDSVFDPPIDGASLVYTIYRSKFPSIYDNIMKETFLDNPYQVISYTNIDPLPFGAESAYYGETKEFNSYLLSYQDRLVEINLNFPMTKEQMRVVKEIFQ